jgi:proline dehydrogenase
MLREALLRLARSRKARRIVTDHAVLRGVARRFVAGETLEEAIAAVRALNRAGLRATLDHLGEEVADRATATAAAEAYLATLERIAESGVASTVSLKLSQLGLTIDDELAERNARRVVECAERLGNAVRIDMEGSAYTQRTLDIFRRLSRRSNAVGIVVQAYLHRTERDVEDLIAEGASVRLCKGAYDEPPEVAFPDKRDVDRNYVRLLERLLRGHGQVAIATHDVRIIRHAARLIAREGIPRGRYDFEMLYGVRRDLQRGLARRGQPVRAYVPFGDEWYPYLTRRLAERPANLLFVLASVLKEVGGRS